jgi:hypothetical protein
MQLYKGYTSTQLVGGQLKQLRDEAVHVERNKRSKRIEKQENQHSWSFQQIKEARKGVRKPIPRIEKEGRRKLILMLPCVEPNEAIALYFNLEPIELCRGAME